MKIKELKEIAENNNYEFINQKDMFGNWIILNRKVKDDLENTIMISLDKNMYMLIGTVSSDLKDLDVFDAAIKLAKTPMGER